ncbi:MAG TPA: TIR domain-containing protein [Longimicrobium sp.]
MGIRVFISHSSSDKPQVEALAVALRERGIDPWLDKWEIGPGDDIVASINRGLEEAGAGLVVFSPHSRESRWVEAEVSYLTYARIQEGKALIPVVLGDGVWVPPLLRPLARRGIEEVEAIADALHNRRVRPSPPTAPERGRTERVLISLRRADESGVRVTVSIGGEEHANLSAPALPRTLVEAQSAFLRGIRAGVRRNPTAAERASQESGLAQLGRALRDFCLPGGSGEALATLVDGALGTTVEVCFEAEDTTLLGLPFEALRLPDDRPLALQPSVVMLRRPAGLRAENVEPLAGPLKVLVAVGAPDEGNTSAAVLDQEHELQNILDAVIVAQRHENVEVRILEVGNPEVIGAAIAADAYHVLHLSCHGMPGALELEDEEGRAVRTTAEGLVEPIRRTQRPLPLVLLNACHGGVSDGQTASLAESLLRAGVPAVVAMQTTVSDFYATEFARAFYHHLSSREHLLASRALVAARQELERRRQEDAARGASLAETQPEFATPSLYVAGEERPLADFARKKQPLSIRPVYEVAGPVPQLRIDDLIGRRKELRETLRTLRDPSREYAGVVLTGIGGVGKSAVAGRVMQRLAEDGWLVPAHAGRFDIKSIAATIGRQLIRKGSIEGKELGRSLVTDDVDDLTRLDFVQQALAEEPVLLVLDDFEQNLQTGGGAFLDPDASDYLRLLAESARRGRLLLTCRHPVPGAEDYLRRVPVGPLSRAETLKLLQRLDSLRDCDPSDLMLVLRLIGGHPRMLEFLDAVMRGGKGRLPHVTQKLREVLDTQDATSGAAADLQGGIAAAAALGARDVLLAELLDIARSKGVDEVLLQTATSNLPVDAAGVARMLADGAEGEREEVARALELLEDLSLVHRFPDDSFWVHRWTAEGLDDLVDSETQQVRYARAGRYRWWRVEHQSQSLNDGVESVRNFLAGADFDAAVDVAHACFGALRQFRQLIGLAALASEVLEIVPAAHPGFASIADEEAKAHLALGLTDRAFARYKDLLARAERLAQAEPERADYQRDLSVSYNKVGDLYRDLGQGEQARQAYITSLQIRERLAQAEPERADYQRDLSVSYERVGDLYRALGQGEQAREYLMKDLAIAERLAQAEPERADYQRDLALSHERVGDLYQDFGQGEQAHQAYVTALDIRERLAQAEPERADYQRELLVPYQRVGDMYRGLRQPEQARQAYITALQIAERLAQAEPERADYQHVLSVSYNKVGDLYRALGQGEQAREYYLKDLAITERLAQSEPERADYQRDLAVSYQRIGDLYRDLGHGDQAHKAYITSLQIAERLAQAEPERADYQRDLVISLIRVGTTDNEISVRGLGLQRALTIVEKLQSRGQLPQRDAGMVEWVRGLLREINGA